ncbi:MAG TPA: hypothetical protein VGI82_14645, partial [Chitinophagaceae bacterium]
MRLIILTDENLKEELLRNGTEGTEELIWIQTPEEFIQYPSADAFIDLLFETNEQRIEILKSLSSKPVIVNSVVTTLKKINAPFIRINGWPGFLSRSIVESSSGDEGTMLAGEKIFSL